MPTRNEFHLLTERRFGPLFVTQFLGAMNDNLYKNALIILIAFGRPQAGFGNSDTLINVAAALFIAPYFLFSAFAGHLADKFEKSILIRITKFIEVILAILATLGFYFDNLTLLLVSLFLLGTQATFFGPLKYSILPEHLKKTELLGGNGLIEMATFLAILLGTVLGAVLIAMPNNGWVWVSGVMFGLAVLGFYSSLLIPKAQSGAPRLSLQWNIITETFHLIREAYHHKMLWHAIIGIAWFWLFGSIYLTQIANYTKIVLGGNEHVTTLLLVAFSIGIGIGSTVCTWLTAKKIDIEFVFLSTICLTLFSLDLSIMSYAIATRPEQNLLAFLQHDHNYRIVCDILLMGVFGGLYLVPLYTVLQVKSEASFRSRIIATNNIVNALFMVCAAILAIVVLKLGFSIPQLFMLISIGNAILGIYLLKGFEKPSRPALKK